MYTLNNELHNFTTNDFYVYEYSINGEVFYVGKGRDDRYKRHIYYRNNKKITSTNPHFYNKVKNCIDSGININISIVFSGNEELCFLKEQELIHFYGLDNLTNINTGGEGYSQPGKPVDQFNKNGEYLASYNNAKEAARLNGWSGYSSICGCCKGRETSYKGYLWAYSGNKPNKLSHNKVVHQWTKEGDYVQWFNDASQAARYFECDLSNITRAIKNKGTSQGFLWSYNKIFPVATHKKKRQVKHINTNTIYQSVTETATTFGHNVGDVSKCCKGTKDSIKGNKFCYFDEDQ